MLVFTDSWKKLDGQSCDDIFLLVSFATFAGMVQVRAKIGGNASREFTIYILEDGECAEI